MAESRLSDRLRQIGVEPLRGRVSALAHLLHRVPAPVLAEQIGMSPWTAQKWDSLVLPDYARYIAGRHTQDSSALGAFGSTAREEPPGCSWPPGGGPMSS